MKLSNQQALQTKTRTKLMSLSAMVIALSLSACSTTSSAPNMRDDVSRTTSASTQGANTNNATFDNRTLGTTTPEQRELEAAFRDSGLQDTMKSLVNEETISAVFSIARVVLRDFANESTGSNSATNKSANDAQAKQAKEATALLEKKLDKVSEELPKKLAPLIGKFLDIAESQVKRAMREQAVSDATKSSTRANDRADDATLNR
jgi:hypothetical protein